jgi:hypothetical protein
VSPVVSIQVIVIIEDNSEMTHNTGFTNKLETDNIGKKFAQCSVEIIFHAKSFISGVL